MSPCLSLAHQKGLAPLHGISDTVSDDSQAAEINTVALTKLRLIKASKRVG